MKKILTILLVFVSVALLTACGGRTEESAPEEEQVAVNEGQNPVMNFVGSYACDRATITVLAKGDKEATVVVDWGNSYDSTTQWTMSGVFDPDELQLEYHDCVKVVYKYAENGDELSREEEYVGGHGFIKFENRETLSLTWQDDQEHAADDMVFTYIN